MPTDACLDAPYTSRHTHNEGAAVGERHPMTHLGSSHGACCRLLLLLLGLLLRALHLHQLQAGTEGRGGGGAGQQGRA